MYLAYCSDNEVFKKDQLQNKQWSYSFPGSGWITCLYHLTNKANIKLVSGDIAIANIISKQWLAKDVLVIQEMESHIGSELLALGAHAFLITCGEAPLYAPFFYDNIDRIAKSFKYSLGFGFSKAPPQVPVARSNLSFRFPSFYLEDMHEIHGWEDRKKIVIVAANKYKSKRLFIPGNLSFMNVLRQLKSASWQVRSAIYKKSLTLSLHDKRLEAIAYFVDKSTLGLYGSGWDAWDELPIIWSKRLKNRINDYYFGLCKNKLETISEYQFSICFENMIWPGYMTEKIIDCFVAGTIPLYLGAPDIETMVPNEAFVDMRNFSSLEHVEDYMNSMTKDEALAMINAGRKYLQSEIGMLHSYEGFADNIINLTKTC